ncbi:MAG: exodeoxyribonuclease VII large subunit [Bacteroidales bacterium]|nr:exodeoxyribonuclease VII large subunit [Bacteroidales bacterium]
MDNNGQISLLLLQELIKESLEDNFDRQLWVRAEIWDLSVNASGHCYLTLVEKDEATSNIVAKVQAIIWASSFRMLRPFFETSTGEKLQAGMQVLLQVRVQYSLLYGLSLIVNNIDPSYTIGSTALERQKILDRLEKEGMLDMNRTLPLPDLPRRFAVISAETAAGYGDFMNHLHGNGLGYKFSTELFNAPMQGTDAPAGIIAALDRVAQRAEDFDAVLIIRGGGSNFDLACFDDYDLAVNIAQYPLPVLTAIGHERDCHVADLVAHTYLKTPTALADFFVDIFAAEEQQIDSLATRMLMALRSKRADAISTVDRLFSRAAGNVMMRIQHEKHGVEMLLSKAASGILTGLHTAKGSIDMLLVRAANSASGRLQAENHKIQLLELRISALNPISILEKGFAIPVKNGRKVSSASDLAAGDSITVVLKDGKADCDVKAVNISQV